MQHSRAILCFLSLKRLRFIRCFINAPLFKAWDLMAEINRLVAALSSTFKCFLVAYSFEFNLI